MTDALALVRVMAWLSPAFPTGGFAYSGGLEAAAQDGLVQNEDDLLNWVCTALRQGSLQLDAKFLSLAHRTDTPGEIGELQCVAEAFAASAPRCTETMAQGRAFLLALNERQEFAGLEAQAALGLTHHTNGCPLPIAIGVATARGGVDRRTAILAFLQNAVGQQLSAGIRLNLMGQTGAARLLDRLESAVVEAMERALDCGQDDLFVASPIADLMAARHDTLDGRIFIS